MAPAHGWVSRGLTFILFTVVVVLFLRTYLPADLIDRVRAQRARDRNNGPSYSSEQRSKGTETKAESSRRNWHDLTDPYRSTTITTNARGGWPFAEGAGLQSPINPGEGEATNRRKSQLLLAPPQYHQPPPPPPAADQAEFKGDAASDTVRRRDEQIPKVGFGKLPRRRQRQLEERLKHYNAELAAAPIPVGDRAEIGRLYFEHNRDNRARWAKHFDAKCLHNWAPVVDRQLANWRDSGIKLPELERYCTRATDRISIVRGKIRFTSYQGIRSVRSSGRQRLVCMLWLLQMTVLRAAAAGRRIPDVELAMQTSDGAQSQVKEAFLWDNPAPLFCNQKCGGDGSVSFPMGIHDQLGARATGAMLLRLWDEKTEEFEKDLGTGAPPWTEKVCALIHPCSLLVRLP